MNRTQLAIVGCIAAAILCSWRTLSSVPCRDSSRHIQNRRVVIPPFPIPIPAARRTVYRTAVYTAAPPATTGVVEIASFSGARPRIDWVTASYALMFFVVAAIFIKEV